MQPLDIRISLVPPLKTFYVREIEQWMRRNNGRFVTMYQIVKFFGRDYLRATTSQRSRECSQWFPKMVAIEPSFR